MSSRANWICPGLLLLYACGTASPSDFASAGGADGGALQAADAPKRVPAKAPLRRVHGHFPGDLVNPQGTPGFWWIGAESTDSSAIPNDGVRATIQSVDYAPSGGCFDCWTSNMLANQYWGQIGFSACDPAAGPAFTAFYQIWNTGVTPNVLLVDGETTAVTADNHEFAMNVQTGTVWSYALDGVVFGTYDMGSDVADAAYGVATLCEEGDGVTAPFVPPQVAMPAAMDVLQSGTWAPASAGAVYNTAGLSGVVGHLQDAGIPDEAVVVGGSAPYLATNTLLWSSAAGGEAPDAGANPSPPAFVIISSPLAASTVSGSVPFDAIVTSATALDNVTFYVQSATTSYSATPCTLTVGPFDCPWDTTTVANGQYYLTVQAEDTLGITTWADIEVTVANSGVDDGGAEDGGSDAGVPDGGGVADASEGADGGADAAMDSGGASDAGTGDDAATGADASGGGADAETPLDAARDAPAISSASDAGEDAAPPPSDDAGTASPSAGGGGCSCDLTREPANGGGAGLAFALAVLAGSARRRRHVGRQARHPSR